MSEAREYVYCQSDYVRQHSASHVDDSPPSHRVNVYWRLPEALKDGDVLHLYPQPEPARGSAQPYVEVVNPGAHPVYRVQITNAGEVRLVEFDNPLNRRRAGVKP